MRKHKLTGEGGKGSTPRTNTNSKQYQDNWDTIFGNTKKVKEALEEVNEKFPDTLNSLDNAEYPQRDNINNRNK